MTQNQEHGGISKEDQKKSVDEIELTQNQVYGVSANTDNIELTQNQVYGSSHGDTAQEPTEGGQYEDTEYEIV